MRESARVRRSHESVGQLIYEDFVTDDNATALDVWRALAGLPPALRDVIVLFYFDDLKSDEIAVVLGVAHATVRTRLARARERLHGLLEDYADRPRQVQREIRQHGS